MKVSMVSRVLLILGAALATIELQLNGYGIKPFSRTVESVATMDSTI